MALMWRVPTVRLNWIWTDVDCIDVCTMQRMYGVMING